MVKYLEETDLKDLAGDALILLINLFDEKTVQVASTAFSQKLIDSLAYLVDENTRYAVVSILVCVLPYYEKSQPSNNIILDEFIRLERQDFYREMLVYLANRPKSYRLDKCMQCIKCIMTNERSAELFNTNDIELIWDIGLRELEN